MFSSNYFEPWKNYQTPIVRQLAFAIASPNLVQCFPSEIQLNQTINIHITADWKRFYFAYQNRLAKLDQNPTELIEFLAKTKSTRLGLRFENLLWFWLQDSQNQYFQLLGHSIQNHQNGKTLGEIDFLVKNLTNNQIEHWEVCLKYYLAEADLSLNTWIGLNPDDTFAHKLKHLVNKQFQFQSALNHTIDSKKMIIKGQLYLPQTHHTLPQWINLERRLGSWQDHIPNDPTYIRLSRAEWLCPNLSHLQNKPTQWWTNGLYFQPLNEYFMMLKFKQKSNIFRS